MKNEGYQIGEVCKITGIPKDTLHFYIKSGLLKPDYIDPENHYNYFSRWNMYQLDIITTCRNLGVPLEKVKQILSSRDNQKVVNLLREYQQEALRLSRYYQQVAEDIDWYQKEDQNIQIHSADSEIRIMHLDEETVLVGNQRWDDRSYHANLQSVLQEEMRGKHFIRRNYGYFLDTKLFSENHFLKYREYVKLPDRDYSGINPEHLYTFPSGDYAVFTSCIQDETSDFSSCLNWLNAKNLSYDLVLAEELGFQLFKYIHEYYCEIRVHLTNTSEK